jgi:hypothetical protein
MVAMERIHDEEQIPSWSTNVVYGGSFILGIRIINVRESNQRPKSKRIQSATSNVTVVPWLPKPFQTKAVAASQPTRP